MSTATEIEYRALGFTGLDLSVVGFGSWAAGGGGRDDTADVESFSCVLRRLREGHTSHLGPLVARLTDNRTH